MAVKVFCSYAHEDGRWRERLETHLAPLINSDLIEFWYDREILAGSDWQSEIDRNLDAADIILLLISPDFLASDYCTGREMEAALQKHENDEAVVLPVILRPSDWENTPIRPLQVLPAEGNPISSYEDEDQALNEVAGRIREQVELRLSHPSPPEGMLTEIEFVNRIDELREITKTSPATYLLISAPMEYGKTRLLQKVIDHMKEKSFCIYLPLSGQDNLNVTQLAGLILSACNVKPSDNISGEQVGLELLKAAHAAGKDEVLVCIDDMESISSMAIRDLLNEFIPVLELKLSRTPRSPVDLRIIFSSRQPTRWLQTSSQIILKELKLTPFDYDSVHQTVRKFRSPHLPSISSEYVQDYAKHLMWFTGGHPGAMAKIISNGDFGLDISSNEQMYYDSIVEPVIHQIRKKQIPLAMQDIFDILSPVRRIDPKLLQHFMECGLITWERSPFELEDELIKTRLFGIDDGFTPNDSTRQLLSIRMRKEQSQQFMNACNEAIFFFRNELQRLEFRPELYAIEILYLELQLQAIAERRDSENLITTSISVVQHLKSAPAAHRLLASFKHHLLLDWEFDFVLNYLFPDYDVESFLKKIL